VHVRRLVYGLRGPALIVRPRHAGDVLVLVHVIFTPYKSENNGARRYGLHFTGKYEYPNSRDLVPSVSSSKLDEARQRPERDIAKTVVEFALRNRVMQIFVAQT
jgi:hypothetical protein